MLIGGTNNDLLFGGAGDDRYEFSLANLFSSDVPGAPDPLNAEVVIDLSSAAGEGGFDVAVFTDVPAAALDSYDPATTVTFDRVDIDGDGNKTDFALIDATGTMQFVSLGAYDGGDGGVEAFETSDAVLFNIVDGLIGGDGNDRLADGAGSDSLYGGTSSFLDDGGNDIYILRPDGALDTIFSFYDGSDLISMIGYTDGGGAPIDFADLTLTQASATDVEIVTPDGDTPVASNGFGLLVADFTAADFLFA